MPPLLLQQLSLNAQVGTKQLPLLLLMPLPLPALLLLMFLLLLLLLLLLRSLRLLLQHCGVLVGQGALCLSNGLQSSLQLCTCRGHCRRAGLRKMKGAKQAQRPIPSVPTAVRTSRTCQHPPPAAARLRRPAAPEGSLQPALPLARLGPGARGRRQCHRR
jgi:hypothetical protein